MTTTQKDAYEAMLAHHQALSEAVKLRVERIKSKVTNKESAESAVADLILYLNSEVVPHAIVEEYTLYQVAVDKLGLSELVEEMTSEHRVLVSEITALENISNSGEAVEHFGRFALLFSQHVAKENDLILPRLLSSNNVELAEALAEMHALFEAAKESATSTQANGTNIPAVLVSLLLDATKELAKLLDATKELAKSGQRDQAARLTASAWAALEAERPGLANKTTVALHRLVNSRNSEPVTLRNHKIIT